MSVVALSDLTAQPNWGIFPVVAGTRGLVLETAGFSDDDVRVRFAHNGEYVEDWFKSADWSPF
jgi:hypothetical protein